MLLYHRLCTSYVRSLRDNEAIHEQLEHCYIMTLLKLLYLITPIKQ